MQYPLQQLVYIAPILFIVMMIGFPIIGVFSGWKRAAYWGGGNILFYLIAIIIWVCANQSICNSITQLINNIIGGKLPININTKIVSSLIAPIFFLIVVLLGNSILLINYYAWFKRVVGLSKYKTIKKKSSSGVVTKKVVLIENNYSKKYKIMNMLIGGVGMGALMAPIVFLQLMCYF